MSFQSQIDIIMGCVELSEEQQIGVYNEWEKGVYEDSAKGETRALNDLLRLARDASLSEAQQEQEQKRLSRSIDTWLQESK